MDRAVPRARAVARPVGARVAVRRGRRRADRARLSLGAAGEHLPVGAARLAAAARRRPLERARGGDGLDPVRRVPVGPRRLSQSESPLADVVSWVGSTGLASSWSRSSRASSSGCACADGRTCGRAIPVAALALVALLAAGLARRRRPGSCGSASVQGNGPAGYFDERAPGDVLAAQLEATEPLLDEPASTCCSGPRAAPTSTRRAAPTSPTIFDDLSEQLDAPLVLNTVTTRDDEFFNTSLLWRAGEGAVDSYDKRNPVPFGEYVPDRCVLGAARPRPHRPHPARVHARARTRRSSTSAAPSPASRSAST